MQNNTNLLAKGVIEQACIDYFESSLKLKMSKVKKYSDVTVYKARLLKKDCVTFFRSEWCKHLDPNIDGDELMYLIDILVESEVTKKLEKKKKSKSRRKEGKD